jgi:predicted Zn-dependent protease with MMP-like domain
MTPQQFEQLIAEEFPRAVPEKFQHLLHNVAFLAEDEPSPEVRQEEGLGPGETLLGLYHGVPATARGDHYGLSPTLPDTITLYRLPLMEEAAYLHERHAAQKEHTYKLEFTSMICEACMRQAIRETIWHEVAHHFGYDEHQVRGREEERDSL